MYESHFSLTGNPFRAATESDLIYQSAELREALDHFTYALDSGESFVLLTGEVGCGKTTAVRAFQQRLGDDVLMATISHSTLSASELLHEVAVRFGVSVDPRTSKPQLIAHLEEFWRRRRASGATSLLVLDEAQLLKPAVLEELRLLSNLEHESSRLVHVFLVGQPEIEDRLRQPKLRPLRQRISLRYKLKPLDYEETRRYLTHRLAAAGAASPSELFTSGAVFALHYLSHGLPREINVIAGRAMLTAFVADAQQVDTEHVQMAKSESGFEGVAESSSRRSPTHSATVTPLEPPGIALQPVAAPPPPPAVLEPAPELQLVEPPPPPSVVLEPAPEPHPVEPPLPPPAVLRPTPELQPEETPSR